MSESILDIRSISSTKTYRYVSLGKITKKTKYFWFLLHGSHMLCEQMAYKFSNFDLDEHFIISAEGGNRFYQNGFGGEVVASWMTSRDRLHEIENFSEYLSKLYQKYSVKLPDDCKRLVLGFSQGATTAFRWLHDRQEKLDVLIDYAGWIPEDIDLKQAASDLSKLHLIFSYGRQDQFLTNDRVEKLQAIIDKNQLKVELMPYEGKHKVERKQLEHIFKCIK